MPVRRRSPRSAHTIVLAAMLLLTGATQVRAASAAQERSLIVGTKEAPPFSIEGDDGAWSGLSIDLWRQIAGELGLDYEFRAMTLPELLDALENGSIDAGVAALTITEEREGRFDFTHPFHSAGLGIAIRPRGGLGLLAVVRRIFSPQFLTVIGGLALLLLAVGVAVWAVERRRNPEQFEPEWARGIGSGFWWSAVTMTTVGYGDKAPATGAGRLIALVWMFAGLILISTFTAAITTTLTVSRLESSVTGPDDLPRIRVGTVPASTSARYLEDRSIRYRAFETPADALEALALGELDAVVYDSPILRHLIETTGHGVRLRVLPTSFETQHYAIGLPEGSPLRERVNRALLGHTGSPEWRERLRSYLGEN